LYLAAQHTELSLKVIGFQFGKRDHSTVIHANKKIKDYIAENNEEIVASLKAIRDALRT
jgi:chromosomal replication initiator protein